MALDSVSNISSTPSSSHISQQDFLKILLTQLTAQDPLKPMDNTAFVAQLAQFTQLEQTQQLSASMNQLVSVQTATQTIGLLGRTVALGDGATAAGQVTGVSVGGTTPVVTIHPASGPDLIGVARKQISEIR